MHVFSQAVSLELMDGCACALLAAAASCRARNFGAHITGAIVLGFLCGLAGPLFRELVLHGQKGAVLVVSALPGEALTGSIGAIFALFIIKSRKMFFWLDSFGMALATSLGAVLAFPETGIVGALVTGLGNGLLPGVARDASLGDVAAIVEKDWYAMAAALGALLSLFLILLPHLMNSPVYRLGEWAVAGGTAATLVLRFWKGRSVEEGF